jgi:hypothetical protein
MQVRIQLTSYFGGKYAKGEGANFEVPDADARSVREVLEVIGDIARIRHVAAVASGASPSKGGWRVRIQISNKTGKGGAYLQQDGSEDGSLEVPVPGMKASQVAPLVDHQVALRFGVRRGDPADLVRAWEAFAGKGPEVPQVHVGKLYSERTCLGRAAVVTHPGMVVQSLWATEREAIMAARRTNCRVIDREGWLVGKAAMDAVPEAAPDRPSAGV